MVMMSRRGSDTGEPFRSGLDRRVACADDVLVEIDVGAGHQPGFVRSEIGAGAGDLLRIDEPSERLRLRCGFEPIFMIRSSPGVDIQPMLRPLTRIRNLTSEWATLRVRVARAPLEAQ